MAVPRVAPSEVAEACGASEKLLKWCSSHGDKAVAAMAKATPPHPGVPYVLINGRPLAEEKDLLKEVCQAYEGEPESP